MDGNLELTEQEAKTLFFYTAGFAEIHGLCRHINSYDRRTKKGHKMTSILKEKDIFSVLQNMSETIKLKLTDSLLQETGNGK